MGINNDKVCYAGCPCDQVFQQVAPWCKKPAEKYAFSTMSDPEGKLWIEEEKRRQAKREADYAKANNLPYNP